MPDRPACCSTSTNCLVAKVDDAGTVWLYSTRRPEHRLAVDADEWASRPAELGGAATTERTAAAPTPRDAPKWMVTAWHCSCHAVEWRRRTPSPPGRPPAPGVPAGTSGGLFWYDTVDEFLADGHRDLTPVDVSNVAALIADFHDLVAEHAKTVSNFEEYAESAVERAADLEHEVEALRRINRELNDGNTDLNQLVLDAQHERDQLRYERRLLGYARLVLDRTAELGSLHPVDREGLPAEAADIAQRIVDEIGHPVTDWPALGPSYRKQIAALTAERDALRASRNSAEADAGQLRNDLEQARRDAAGWEDWGKGWKAQVEASHAERDKAWADLDAARAERHRRTDELTRAQQVLDHVRRAVHVADTQDAADWQRGYRACSQRALEALDSDVTLVPRRAS